MKCDCVDWSENIDEVNAPLLLQAARNPQTHVGYTGKRFVYCPWCATALHEENTAGVSEPIFDSRNQDFI